MPMRLQPRVVHLVAFPTLIIGQYAPGATFHGLGFLPGTSSSTPTAISADGSTVVGHSGNSPFRWLKPHGYDFWFAGENLAAGFETAEVMVEGWMESKGHRDNILSPMYADCGIAILEGSTTGRATGYSVVVIFGREQPDLKPTKQARK